MGPIIESAANIMWSAITTTGKSLVTKLARFLGWEEPFEINGVTSNNGKTFDSYEEAVQANNGQTENIHQNSNGTATIMDNDIDIDDNESYLVAYPTLYVPINNPTSTLSSILLSNNNSSFTDVINDQNEIFFEKFKGLVTNIDIGRFNLCLDRGSNYISRDLEYFGNEEIMEKSIEEKIDFIIQQVTNKEFLLQTIRSEHLYIGESSFITPRNPSIVKNSKSVISELLEVLKICEIEEEIENE